MKDQLRRLPQVQALLETDGAQRLIERHGHADVANAIRTKIESARALILARSPAGNPDFSSHDWLSEIADDLHQAERQTLRPAINATGVIIHTNLGRACLAPEAIDAMQAVATSYSTLELDLETGKRGSRHAHVEALICKLTGADAALVVNNCAGAILTSLCALGAGREIVASRGEMVEIGGSFRMPDVITQSGGRLVEIGTTNKTHLSDYADALNPDTAILLKSHTSNYAVVGFTAVPSRQDLSDLAHAHGKILVEDLGSGVLIDLKPYGLKDEPVVRDVLAAGVDLVTFSGDKLLGGPQAGIIAGRRDLIDQIKRHPMARAVRIDKLSLAALRATLDLYSPPNNPIERIPVLQILAEPVSAIRDRAERLVSLLPGPLKAVAKTVSTTARAGAGALPLQDLPSYAVALESPHQSAEDMSQRLRASEPPVLGRISKDRCLLDMRAVAESELPALAEAITQSLDQ